MNSLTEVHHILVGIMLFLFCACSSSKQSVTPPNPQFIVNQKYTVLSNSSDFDKVIPLYKEFHTIDSFKLQDTSLVEQILTVVIQESNADDLSFELGKLVEINQYYKQVIPFKTKNGHKLLWVNCFCEYSPYWKTRVVQVDDGGSCYFNVIISLEKRTYRDLIINGV